MYQRSHEGRRGLADRQQAYRERRRALETQKVTHQGSPLGWGSGSIADIEERVPVVELVVEEERIDVPVQSDDRSGSGVEACGDRRPWRRGGAGEALRLQGRLKIDHAASGEFLSRTVGGADTTYYDDDVYGNLVSVEASARQANL